MVLKGRLSNDLVLEFSDTGSRRNWCSRRFRSWYWDRHWGRCSRCSSCCCGIHESDHLGMSGLLLHLLFRSTIHRTKRWVLEVFGCGFRSGGRSGISLFSERTSVGSVRARE
jgi:hypothetical protein